MSTIDWPEALIPQTSQLALRKSGQQFSSPFNGTTQALEFIADRWVLSVSLAQIAARNPRGVGSFCNRLAGGVERVRGWNFGHNRGVPRGTLRGSPTLSTGVVRGDVALPVTGAAAGTNMLTSGGFEIDTNVDGLADGWMAYSNGSVTGGTPDGLVAGNGSTYAQRMYAAVLGALSVDAYGLRKSADVAVTAGQSYTFAADVRGTNTAGASVRLLIDWYTAGLGYISGSSVTSSMITTWARRSATAAAPPTAAFARLYIWMEAGTTGAAIALEVDNVQFEQGAAPTAYSGFATLLADDMISAGGQLFQVAADTTLNDAGAGSVPVVNRVRDTIGSATAVVWNRPTAEFILPAMQAGPVYRPGAIENTALDLVEVWG